MNAAAVFGPAASYYAALFLHPANYIQTTAGSARQVFFFVYLLFFVLFLLFFLFSLLRPSELY